MDTGAVHIKIRNIGPGNDNLLLRGVLVRKNDPRVVRIKRDNRERCVWTFTLRDSPSDFINVNVWGSPEFVKGLCNGFQIGDIVDVLNVKAVFRKVSDGDDLYQPAVTSSFSATFNEDQSDMRLCTTNFEEYTPLLAIPTKPPGNFLTITDIHSNGQKLRGQYTNLLAAVRNLEMKRHFKSRDGREFECRDVILIDQTYQTLHLTVWGADLLAMSNKWTERATVLFLADVRVEWNEFRQMITVCTTGRTVITENPRTMKAENLKNFIISTPFQIATTKFDQIVNKYRDTSLITAVMSCNSVDAKSREKKQNTEFTALVYALVDSFSIDDAGENRFLATKCTHCNWKVDPGLEICLNANCLSGSGQESINLELMYDIRITLLDHTGSILNCRLTNEMATKMIGYKAASFQALSIEEKTSIKWRFLLKYCAARIVVLPIRERGAPMVSVLSLDLIPLSQYSSVIPMM